jgi:hypothetical protein
LSETVYVRILCAVERNERLRAALEEIINYMETPDYVREIARRALEGDGCENSTVATMK